MLGLLLFVSALVCVGVGAFYVNKIQLKEEYEIEQKCSVRS